MAGTHSGQPGNPVPNVDRIGEYGAGIAPLLTCGGVEPDGSNLVAVFVMAVTNDDLVHMGGNVPPEYVVGQLMFGTPAPAPDPSPLGIVNPITIEDLLGLMADIDSLPEGSPEGQV